MLTSRRIAVTITLLLMIGCRPSVETQSAQPTHELRYKRPARSEMERLQYYGSDIQRARDGSEEAEAIQRLQQHLAHEHLTYRIDAVRTVDDRAVDSISTSRELVRVRVEVFRGQQPLQMFTFVPKDNRNLALLGR